ncbi:MAG: tetratricopeptide repeat protein [Acidobacteriia bacterium]|nr:tetratricopeptide repeat protein [Terriglobia bacterium]
MTRTLLAVMPALLSSALVLPGWPQSSPPTAQEVLSAALADMRGRKEIIDTSGTRNELWFSSMAAPMISTVSVPVRQSPGTVSAKRLRHRPPKAARQAYDKAARIKDAGKAALELEKAIALDSDFAEAHNDLGVVYTRLGRYPEAGAEFRRAIELVPEESLPHSNLAWVLSAMGQRAEAESH